MCVLGANHGTARWLKVTGGSLLAKNVCADQQFCRGAGFVVFSITLIRHFRICCLMREGGEILTKLA